jgi:hypothetical protein
MRLPYPQLMGIDPPQSVTLIIDFEVLIIVSAIDPIVGNAHHRYIRLQ